jgi:hypothetical protein
MANERISDGPLAEDNPFLSTIRREIPGAVGAVVQDPYLYVVKGTEATRYRMSQAVRIALLAFQHGEPWPVNVPLTLDGPSFRLDEEPEAP